MYELVTGGVLARAVAEQGVLRNIVRAIGLCPPPLQAHYGADGASIRWVLAEQNTGATSQGHVSVAASGAATCVMKTLPWKPSDRLACEELLQDTWMQASRGSQDSYLESYYLLLVDDGGRMAVDESGEEAGEEHPQNNPVP